MRVSSATAGTFWNVSLASLAYPPLSYDWVIGNRSRCDFKGSDSQFFSVSHFSFGFSYPPRAKRTKNEFFKFFVFICLGVYGRNLRWIIGCLSICLSRFYFRTEPPLIFNLISGVGYREALDNPESGHYNRIRRRRPRSHKLFHLIPRVQFEPSTPTKFRG